ncbi:hypothetical protein [Brevibacillus porteri]
MANVKCEGCQKQMIVDQLEDCTYTVFADGLAIGQHVLCINCAN